MRGQKEETSNDQDHSEEIALCFQVKWITDYTPTSRQITRIIFPLYTKRCKLGGITLGLSTFVVDNYD